MSHYSFAKLCWPWWELEWRISWKWHFLKPLVPSCSRAERQYGALQDHVKCFFFLLLLPVNVVTGLSQHHMRGRLKSLWILKLTTDRIWLAHNVVQVDMGSQLWWVTPFVGTSELSECLDIWGNSVKAYRVVYKLLLSLCGGIWLGFAFKPPHCCITASYVLSLWYLLWNNFLCVGFLIAET